MKKWLFTAIILCLAVSEIPADQAEEKSYLLGNVELGVSAAEWLAKGDFRMLGHPAGAANRWELKHPSDTNLGILTLSAKSTDERTPYLISLSLGQGAIKKDTVRDTDWDTNGTVSDLSYSTSSGDTYLIHYRLGYKLTSQYQPANRPVIYFTLGRIYLKNKADYRDPTVTVASYVPVNNSWTEKWQFYTIRYEGNEMGITGASPIYDDKLTLGISFGYTPYLAATYNGLRYPERPTTQQQSEYISASGDALTYEVNLKYRPSRNLSLAGGYRYLRFRSEGKDQPGTAWAGSEEKLDTNYKGFFGGLTINF